MILYWHSGPSCLLEALVDSCEVVINVPLPLAAPAVEAVLLLPGLSAVPLQAQVCQNLRHRVASVQHVKVDARHPGIPQPPHLAGGVFNAKLSDGVVVVAEFFKLLV